MSVVAILLLLLEIFRSFPSLTTSTEVISSSLSAILNIFFVAHHWIPPFLVAFQDEICFGKALILTHNNTRSQERPSARVERHRTRGIKAALCTNSPGYEQSLGDMQK